MCEKTKPCDVRHTIEEWELRAARDELRGWGGLRGYTRPSYSIELRLTPEQAEALASEGSRLEIVVTPIRERQIAAVVDVLTHRNVPPHRKAELIVDAVTAVKP